MDNIGYIVRRDFLAPAALKGVSAELLVKLEMVEAILQSDPCPKKFGCKSISTDTFKVKVSDDEEELLIRSAVCRRNPAKSLYFQCFSRVMMSPCL